MQYFFTDGKLLTALIAGMVSLLVGVITAIVTLSVANRKLAFEQDKNNTEQQQANRRIISELKETNKRSFLQKQMELLFDAVDTATCLAITQDPNEFEKARRKFYHLLLALNLVVNHKVESALFVISNTMSPAPANTLDLPLEELRNPTYALSHAVRDLLSSSWNVQLSELPRRS